MAESPNDTLSRLVEHFSSLLKNEPNPDKENARRTQLENQHFQARIAQIEAVNKDVKSNRNLRIKYAGRVYRFLKYWVSGAGLLVLIDAIQWPDCSIFDPESSMSLLCRSLPSFDVESSILLAVVGGTTVAVIGLVLAVIRGLFKDPDPPAPNTPPSSSS